GVYLSGISPAAQLGDEGDRGRLVVQCRCKPSILGLDSWREHARQSDTRAVLPGGDGLSRWQPAAEVPASSGTCRSLFALAASVAIDVVHRVRTVDPELSCIPVARFRTGTVANTTSLGHRRSDCAVSLVRIDRAVPTGGTGGSAVCFLDDGRGCCPVR